jgi:hypothetical protein
MVDPYVNVNIFGAGRVADTETLQQCKEGTKEYKALATGATSPPVLLAGRCCANTEKGCYQGCNANSCCSIRRRILLLAETKPSYGAQIYTTIPESAGNYGYYNMQSQKDSIFRKYIAVPPPMLTAQPSTYILSAVYHSVLVVNMCMYGIR